MTRTEFIVGCLACLACFPGQLFAQGETTSAVGGAVADPSGSVLPRAAVTIINTETGSKRGAVTDDAGRFSFPQLKPGSYTVKVVAEGFEPQSALNVAAGLGQKQTVDFTLKLAAALWEITNHAPR